MHQFLADLWSIFVIVGIVYFIKQVALWGLLLYKGLRATIDCIQKWRRRHEWELIERKWYSIQTTETAKGLQTSIVRTVYYETYNEWTGTEFGIEVEGNSFFQFDLRWKTVCVIEVNETYDMSMWETRDEKEKSLEHHFTHSYNMVVPWLPSTIRLLLIASSTGNAVKQTLIPLQGQTVSQGEGDTLAKCPLIGIGILDKNDKTLSELTAQEEIEPGMRIFQRKSIKIKDQEVGSNAIGDNAVDGNDATFASKVEFVVDDRICERVIPEKSEVPSMDYNPICNQSCVPRKSKSSLKNPKLTCTQSSLAMTTKDLKSTCNQSLLAKSGEHSVAKKFESPQKNVKSETVFQSTSKKSLSSMSVGGIVSKKSEASLKDLRYTGYQSCAIKNFDEPMKDFKMTGNRSQVAASEKFRVPKKSEEFFKPSKEDSSTDPGLENYQNFLLSEHMPFSVSKSRLRRALMNLTYVTLKKKYSHLNH